MNRQDAAPRWWSREIHSRRRPHLLARARIAAALRAHFSAGDFLEVEPSLMQASPGNETHLHGFATQRIGLDGARETLYLHTSPEFAMKKLLAAGEERIFALVPVFRNREEGRLHSNEFTMLEWYRAGEDWTVLMEDCAALLALAARVAGRDRWTWRGVECDATALPERLTLVEAFAHHAGVDLEAALPRPDEGRQAPLGRMAALARAAGIRLSQGDTWSDLFSKVVTERIEPHLGRGRPTILSHYPISEAALARPAADPRFAERFELYVCGVELANAFGELTDAAEQEARFHADMAEKQHLYGESYPIDGDFIAALAIMPQASGAALGFDRLAMLATGAASVADIRWTP